ncbi:MAG: hypothetical protein D6730_20970 [Bacteroidetes bacterium]|nr:MAG: hypothetical protein D6730_20970 [Bacteroidota bacterium]
MLREYAAGYLQAAGKWDTLHLATEAGDSLRIHARLHLQDSLRLEVFRFDTLEVTDLHLPESNVEEAFILLQAIITPCNDTDLLDDKILFVKNRAGRIHKIYDREGRVEITEGKRNQIRIRMRTILREGKEN